MKLIIVVIAIFSVNIGLAQGNVFSSYTNQPYNFGTKTQAPLALGYHVPGFNNFLQDTTIVAKPKWIKTDTGKSLVASAALIAIGLYTYKDNGFLNRVDNKIFFDRYFPSFENDLDDYTQFIPYAAVYAFDLAGIKSKHKVLRKTTTIATGAALSLIVINGLKYGIAEPRPDGSANNSFPSGHTATAFMGAHIFHKEYGERSIYYSIGAYMLATITGVFRQLNNRHWSSDVLVGAGLGISLTEFAYFLNDKWYKGKGINEIDYTAKKDPNLNKPSFLGFKIGLANLVDEFVLGDNSVRAQTGFSSDLEGAYFFNKYIGVGGNVGIQSFPVRISDAVKQEFQNQGYDILFEAIGSSRYSVGPFFQYSFGKNRIGSKFLLGGITAANTKIRLTPINSDEISESADVIYAEFLSASSISWSTGIYYKRLVSKQLSLGVYADYNASNLDGEYLLLEDIVNDVPQYTTGQYTDKFDSYSIGVTAEVMLW